MQNTQNIVLLGNIAVILYIANAEIIYSQVNKQEYALNIQEDEFMQKSDFFKYFILVFLIL